MQKKYKIMIIVGIILTIGILLFNSEYIVSRTKSEVIKYSVEDMPGNAPNNTYPLIVLHGFNVIYSTRFGQLEFKEFHDDVSKELDYQNRGILIKETTCSELKYSENPISVRNTYFTIETTDIDDYSKTLNRTIEMIRYCTGAEKVDLVTHSMGGIVARNYIKNIDNSTIRKLVMMGTPNHGGLYSFSDVSNYLTQEGSNLSIDFLQLSENHDFMQRLNEGDETIGDIKYYTIAGNTDGEGDGVVKEESVKLEGAEHFTIDCSHVFMKHPTFCKEALNIIVEILKT